MINWIRRLFCPPQLEDIQTVVKDANDKLGSMIEVQKRNLVETQGIRADLNRVLERLTTDPMPVTGPRRMGN